MNNFLEVINTRCSVREFTGELIPRDDIIKILKAGSSAPTAVNTQPWNFITVTDRETLNKLCDSLPYAKMLDKAAFAIVVCGLPDKDPYYSKEFWVTDCSAATENILLAVHALGYGAVWTAAYHYEDRMQSVRDILSIPQNVNPLCVIPVGIPKNKNQTPKDKFKNEILHWEKW